MSKGTFENYVKPVESVKDSAISCMCWASDDQTDVSRLGFHFFDSIRSQVD